MKRTLITLAELSDKLKSKKLIWVESDYYTQADQLTHGNKAVITLRPPEGSTIIEKENNRCYINTADTLYKIPVMSEKEYDTLYTKYGFKS